MFCSGRDSAWWGKEAKGWEEGERLSSVGEVYLVKGGGKKKGMLTTGREL